MSKIFFLFFCAIFAFAAQTWQHQYRFILKKDEVAKILLYQEDIKNDLNNSFEFRWTLYDYTNIIVHSIYHKFPRQHTLSLRRGLETYSQMLIPDEQTRFSSRAKLFLVFEEFDKKNKLATFDVFIEDENKRLKIEFIDPRRK